MVYNKIRFFALQVMMEIGVNKVLTSPGGSDTIIIVESYKICQTQAKRIYRLK